MSVVYAYSDFDFNVEISHISERKPNPQWKMDGISNNAQYLVAYCLEGEAFYKVEGKDFHIRKSDLLFFPRGVVRSAYANPDHPWSFIFISFDAQFLDEPSREQFDRLERWIRSPHLYKLSPLFLELSQVWTGRRAGFNVKCRSLLMDILYQLLHEQNRSMHGNFRYNAIERTANHILQHYAESFTTDQLASLSGLSASHFRLLFKKITGMTAVQYQNHIRLNKAKDLLLGGGCNVTEAALSVGYHDIYYFSRLFKKMTGKNPSDCIP
ncbi:AraC family transcriptional regulator [Paenibacillus hodogayensis]|uniref:AraC family transcriptional regulator n=1 Tax=Paenibacillus hodogayensis TaxID=279208 RepID=A0ABV5VT18_9BACL